MKKQYFINANIIDPHNSLNERGGLIIGENGLIEAIGKKVNTNNIPSREKVIDLKEKYIFPGLVDMRVFVGEPGYEYKENFRTLSNAALAGGVTSVVTMPNTDPVIDNVSIVDFLKRRGRDKSKINIFPCASLTKNLEGTSMTEFGLLQKKGIIAFTDGTKTIQNTQLMSRIMNSAKDLGTLIMQHAEDYHLSKNGMINSGIIATKLGLSGIPDVAERIIIERDLTLLENIKCRYHISQISSAKSVEILKEVPTLQIETILKVMNLSRNKMVFVMDGLSAVYIHSSLEETTSVWRFPQKLRMTIRLSIVYRIVGPPKAIAGTKPQSSGLPNAACSSSVRARVIEANA